MKHFQLLALACLLALFVPSFASAKPHNDHRSSQSHYQRNDRHRPPSHAQNQVQYVSSMSDDSFNALVQAIKSDAFDSNRIELIKYAEKYNYFSSSQVAYLISLLSFHRNQIEMACLLAPSVLDKENWYQVANQMNFASQRSEILNCMP